MRKRICIFSFYNKNGYLDDYVLYLLNDLSKCASRLIITVNGFVDDRGEKLFHNFTDEIVIRENLGYDAGAYKHILAGLIEKDVLKEYEEVIFCNDTFFGPVKSFVEIFSEMESRKCDFWGLSGYFDSVFTHIQSYFLVFRKKIIKRGLLTKYFGTYVNEKTSILKEIYGQFELGLFDFLVRKNGMSYGCYIQKSHNDVYRSSYICLKEYGLPIIKKKVFSYFQENMDNIWCTLSYIKYETQYDVSLILNYIRQEHGITICKDDIQRTDAYKIPDAIIYPRAVNTEEKIEEFLSNGLFYIYGAGVNGSKCYWRFARNNPCFKGFVVSDGMIGGETNLYGHPILQLSEITDLQSVKILLAVEKQYADEIIKNLEKTSNVMRIF